ncbi:hypothetical protein M407DRAFT_28735 [Tulasnella calospora MUT 4182]|uniref:Uncharacterized protein n=1 Tax=Tulasnella calospora MUT 4182 TaxID=1051891 RepID=A0A0C3KJL1_9AGAM|nr:hypothetical protein M407DRAFT_28735 [Tulasnella calospora MUT 4182]
MLFQLSSSPSHSLGITHSPSSSTTPHKAQQQLISEFANLSSTLGAGYDTPLGQNGAIRNAASTPKHQQRAFPAHPDRTPSYSASLPHDPQQQLVSEFASLSTTLSAGYAAPLDQNGILQTVASSVMDKLRASPAHPENTFYPKFADGGNARIRVSIGDDAPDDLPTFTGVHDMAGDLNAPYLHEIISPLIKDNRARGVVFNLRGCVDPAVTSAAFHHGGSTSDLGAVVTWVTIKWPGSKIYVIAACRASHLRSFSSS